MRGLNPFTSNTLNSAATNAADGIGVLLGRISARDRDGSRAPARADRSGSPRRAASYPDSSAPARALSLLSPDHHAGADANRLRDLQAQRVGGREVDGQLELLRLLDGEVGGPRALQDPVNIIREAAGKVEGVGPVRHQALADAVHGLPPCIHRRKPALSRKVGDYWGVSRGQAIVEDDESAGALVPGGLKRRREVRRPSRFQRHELKAEFPSRGLSLAPLDSRVRIGWIP